jgi:hypothetical protein
MDSRLQEQHMNTMSRTMSALAAFAFVTSSAFQAQTVSTPSQLMSQVQAESQGQSSSQTLTSPQPQAAVQAAPQAQAGAQPEQDADVPETPQSITPGSQVRIVRLSQVKGQAQLDRNTGLHYELALPNLPIVAGEKLRTIEGVAEVEFEDNSSLRLAPNTQIDFPTLGRTAAGATTTAVRVLNGTVYVSLSDNKTPEDFTLRLGKETLTLAPSTHLRIDLNASAARLTVFKGNATVTSPSGALEVEKKKNVTFDVTSDALPIFAKKDISEPFDEWDKNEAKYHNSRTLSASFAGSPYAYGLNDLNYYGSFASFGGCGSLWRPYLVDAAWDPYGSGLWSWYPGAGYSWVSLYPWGWTPFHSGSWEYCPNYGYGWRPSGTWRSIRNHPPLRPIQGPGRPRPLPPHPPKPGQPTLIAVNTRALPISRPGGNGFVFRKDSAGLGVPRGTFNNLGRLSRTAEQHGIATTTISDSQAQRGFIITNNSRAAGGNGYAGGSNVRAAGNGGSFSPPPHSGGGSGNFGGSGTSASSGFSGGGGHVSAPSSGAMPASGGSFSSGAVSAGGGGASAGAAASHGK